MVQSTLAKLLLSPVSLLYGAGVGFRNWAYRRGILRGITFSVPVISVGNLSVGGAGKTPHIEYLIRLLDPYLQIATLSRGYRRKTRGFLVVRPEMTVEEVGDEPLQYARKFPEVMVTVAEERAFAIPEIVGRRPDTQLVLLDDAFQHRAVQPGLNILLTQYELPFTRDYLLPSGRLREWRSGYERADIIVVSKCPASLERSEADALVAEIAPLEHQRVFFSYYDYATPYYLLDPRYRLRMEEGIDVLLISAIANTDYLLQHLRSVARTVSSLEYADHHYFSGSDMGNLKRRFDELKGRHRAIITTEKDATRLQVHREFIAAEQLPVFVLPAEVSFHFEGGAGFDELVREYLLNFRS
ncbi:lipid-A-disaccharide kinase [Neolewinella xylanilytica]|uniref:Tetraacyldisaccharide 4'-kinase n=1 Tax=Neolewinella xylanilytica TaxID=1514080 RepID=A0A2S6I3A9_9BACT|nr:tetraacyldisaccharide 4'-kinase [Neolewinella xylanilytica]PPK85561.1 lipid-A-disaccharide kinase [Neolewinella xylanilytica]